MFFGFRNLIKGESFKAGANPLNIARENSERLEKSISSQNFASSHFISGVFIIAVYFLAIYSLIALIPALAIFSGVSMSGSPISK